ncbi:OF BC1 COMPLEX KINASE 3, chloroplastic [Seminavis robusta]|uniref:OF BC1 COMPLEX KINASE 3, chloroplastic n=1 Tax=Seminavis robusta TaxID=568900 RepID=A0A9N8EJU4_9STRA|nr:OF BC1 COMPLEX KINASE 3, chloroplastic [Seminavis robusta]|eukprot:Sro1101_g241410.1 OF BC1 COMPLEX KINASE 3, chloroplastic (775) ;mRNA; f:15614-18382
MTKLGSSRTDWDTRTWNQGPGRGRVSFSSSTQSTHKNDKQNQVRQRRKTKPMPVTGYDFKDIEETYDRRPLQVGWRLNSLGFPLLGWYISLLMDKATGASENPKIQRMRGEQLRMHLVRSKSVALIKSGQALSLRPDLIRNKIWAEELGKLVDAVGSFSDKEAMRIMKKELADLYPRMEVTKATWQGKAKKTNKKGRRLTSVERLVEKDPILNMFEFYNDNQAVASASIGQVYKAKIRRGPQLEAAIGKEEAAKWGGRTVAIKVQRPDVEDSASLDMYLLRRTAMWLSKFRGGDLPAIADQFGMQLFGELDYIREADNCERFRELYGSWGDVDVPAACRALTRKRVLVMEWVEGEKGPWPGKVGLEMVSIGLRCSVDQLMCTGLFHADPHRGNMLMAPQGKLALIDFGSMADITEEERYGLFGLVIGLQNKDLPLVTENLLKLGFLEDTTQLDQLIPRLRAALMNSTGGTGKASDVNFAQLQAQLDEISRENVLRFSTPPFFTVIIRSLTILEGVALSVDPNFRLVRGAYPYVLRQLLSPEDNQGTPEALTKLLIRLLTVNGEEREIEWERLRSFLKLAQKAAKTYDPKEQDPDDDGVQISRNTIDMFFEFLTSRAGLFLKKPLVHELAEAIDGLASMGEANLLRTSGGLLPVLPGMNGPINTRRMDEIRMMLETFEEAMVLRSNNDDQFGNRVHSDGSNGTAGGGRLAVAQGRARLEAMVEFLREISAHLGDERLRRNSGPLLEELQSVIQMVAVEVLEIRGSRAVRSVLRVQ